MSEPRPTCAATIYGPRYGRVWAWTRRCRNKAKVGEKYCHIHLESRQSGRYHG